MPTTKTEMATDRGRERIVRADKAIQTTKNPITAIITTTENPDKATNPAIITIIITATETSARM